MNLDIIRKNLGVLLGLALLVLAAVHRQQGGTTNGSGNLLLAWEYFAAFGLMLTVLLYHPLNAVAALLKKDRRQARNMLINALLGGILLAAALWLDAATLLKLG